METIAGAATTLVAYTHIDNRPISSSIHTPQSRGKAGASDEKIILIKWLAIGVESNIYHRECYGF